MISNSEKTMEKIVSLCKGRGFVYSGSEIYGGLANTWDYGPLGVEFKNNVKKAWWKKFVQESPYNVGLDCAILMNPQVWVASGHVGGFSDPLMDCKDCKTRHRADKLIEDQSDAAPNGWSNEQMMDFIKENGIKCPECGSTNFTDIRKFNLMFKTFQGVTEDAKNEIFLRPETAQGIFTFRTREFEQMELEFFCKPGEDLTWFTYWKDACKNWLLNLGIREENIRLRDHEQEELSHYSNATTDIEFLFPFGWGELWGVADRTDFDLTQHINQSGKSLEYFDTVTNEKYIPYVIEPSLGADRVALAFLCDAYDEEVLDEKDTRVVMRLHPALAPFKACVLPLSKKLSEEAGEVYQTLAKHFMVDYDDAGSIGKRYRRQDEIGTPFCITYDFESKEDGCVTVRDRDTMEQTRLPIAELVKFIEEKIEF